VKTNADDLALITRLALAMGVACLASTMIFGGQAGPRHPWMNKSLSAEQRANLLLHSMTLNDKIALLHGAGYPTPLKAYAGYVPPNPRLGIPALNEADGRAGVGNDAKDVTLLPAPIAAAATWDTDLMNAYGSVLGEEEWGKGTNVFLGPTIDIVRVPEWGRAFETYGEDPYLNGQMAAVEIKGVQSEGPIANANMYLTMNEETNRFRQNTVVDERTLQEIYLPPFRSAIQQGHVGTFMCAYVKTNGVYSCENPELLTTFLRTELGFQGWILTDWDAAHSTVASAKAGLDQEMPTGRYYGQALKAAVQHGEVSGATLNELVGRILVTMFRYGLFDKPQPGNWNTNVRTAAHALFSRRVAEQGMVLLKNEHNILPLSENTSIAVIGAEGGTKPLAEGGGSSYVIPPYVVSPLDGIRHRAGNKVRLTYANGSDLAEAAKLAQAATVAIVFAGAWETEGEDRPNLELPRNQNQLVSVVARANSNTIVVLNTGGAVLMPWINEVRGVIEAWYPGQEDGNAIAAVLFGDVDPGGKLPLTFPRTETEVATGTPEQWPGGTRTSHGFQVLPIRPSRTQRVEGTSVYSEKLDVGYRWYDAHHVHPLFPFGYGLSYTTFKLSHLQVTPTKLQATGGRLSQEVTAQVVVTNTGRQAGAEVVQAYVQQPANNGEPPRQLRAFAKVFLKPGQTRPVKLVLGPRSFSIYDTAVRQWRAPAGTYQILVGTSSALRDLPLRSNVELISP
jgi:beta-glucosidase